MHWRTFERLCDQHENFVDVVWQEARRRFGININDFIIQACEEFLAHGLKYIFPARLGEIARGVPTSYAAPSLNKQIIVGNDPIPVWPYGEGSERGVALKPLYPSVPEAVIKHPDPLFYDLLTLIDAIRSGRARERHIATQKVAELLKSYKFVKNE